MRFVPDAGLNASVIAWSAPSARKPVDASQLRSFSSSRSPGAANGRLVAPSAALKVFSVPGIRLQAARVSTGIARRASARTGSSRGGRWLN